MNRSEPLYGLSGTLWPIHIKPQPDELLSSWIIRLSHAHGYKAQTMCAIFFGGNNTIWNRDIDRSAPADVKEVLANATGATNEQIENATLGSYEGTLFERHIPNGVNRWIVPLGIFHRNRRRPGLLFCPQCLDEDTEPYFRRRWRLAFSTICTRHGCYLLDTCPECNSPLAPHRADMLGRQHFPRAGLNVHCWNCAFDLRTSKKTNVLDTCVVELQARLEFALVKGYADFAGNSAMHPIVFFDGLRSLIAGITSRQTQTRLKKSTKFNNLYLSELSRTGLEMEGLSTRRELFRVLATILERWPANFIDLIHECRLRYSDLKGDSKCRSFWYEDVIRHEAGGGFSTISHKEAEAIASAVEAQYGHFSDKLARRLSGRDIHLHITERSLDPVSDAVYEDLLSSIDHQIAGKLDKIGRACLIRDKIMFAAGRQLGLSERALANLTLDRVRSLAPEKVDVDFRGAARTPAQARAWVEWYWDKERPRLRPVSDTDCVFTSVSTRHEFRRSTVGARFKKLVNIAMLGRTIHSYEHWRGGHGH